MKYPSLLHASLSLFFLISITACSRADDAPAAVVEIPETAKSAIFAGGCFWCMEPPFEKLNGVYSVVSGYTGGPENSPSYKDVSAGRTGHREAVKVTYDPATITYAQLLDTFWRSIDPTQSDGQFTDRGSQYKTGIFYANKDEKATAGRSKKELASSGRFDKSIVVEILPAKDFHPAEEYHQDYYKKNPRHYKSYSRGSGRAGFLERTWAG